jgi:glycosyltransferase involved in cell wall biosynthesis
VGIETTAADERWLQGAGCVVLPAWVEHAPRRLLEAIGAGVPVIATDACGLDGMDGVITVPVGDGEALKAAIEGVLVSA